MDPVAFGLGLQGFQGFQKTIEGDLIHNDRTVGQQERVALVDPRAADPRGSVEMIGLSGSRGRWRGRECLRVESICKEKDCVEK